MIHIQFLVHLGLFQVAIKKKKKSEVILNKREDGPAAERGQKVWEDEGQMEGLSPRRARYSFYCASANFLLHDLHGHHYALLFETKRMLQAGGLCHRPLVTQR